MIADALGVPAGSVSDWLHLHLQSDLVDVPCQSLEVMPMQDGVSPYWLRVWIEGREQPVDLHSQWSSVGADGAYVDTRHWRDVAGPALDFAVSRLTSLNGDEKLLAATEAPAPVWTPATRTAVGAAALLLGLEGWAKSLDGIGRGDPSRDPSRELFEVLRRAIDEHEEGWLVGRVASFDKDGVPQATLAELQKFVDKEKLMAEETGAFFSQLEATSKTAAALWSWVVAIDTYAKCFRL